MSERPPHSVVHLLIWPDGMTAEEKKQQSVELIEKIPGYSLAFDPSRSFLLAYSESFESLLDAIDNNKLEAVIAYNAKQGRPFVACLR